MTVIAVPFCLCTACTLSVPTSRGMEYHKSWVSIGKECPINDIESHRCLHLRMICQVIRFAPTFLLKKKMKLRSHRL